jgi:hypothetical protein
MRTRERSCSCCVRRFYHVLRVLYLAELETLALLDRSVAPEWPRYSTAGTPQGCTANAPTSKATTVLQIRSENNVRSDIDLNNSQHHHRTKRGRIHTRGKNRYNSFCFGKWPRQCKDGRPGSRHSPYDN